MVGRQTRVLGPISGVGSLLLFYLPLAASGLLMTLQQPVVNAGIARSDNVAVQLAAYGATLSIIVLLESPIQMLLQTASALVVDARSFQLVQRLMLLGGLALSAVGLLISGSPLAVIVTEELLGLPPEVGATTRLALWAMLPWPLIVAWRRFYQGVLIGTGRANVIVWATICRLLSIALAVVVGLNMVDSLPGALLGVVALAVGATVEAVVVTWWARPATVEIAAGARQPASIALTFPALLSFYAPLAATSAMAILVWPIISGALARAPASTVSLAAWPIVLGVWWLLGTPLQMLQQVVIAALRGGVALPVVRRLTVAAGVSATVLLGAAAFTPVMNILVRDMIAAPPQIAEAVEAALQVLLPLPLLASVQALLQGELIVSGATREVRTAMAANLAVLVLVLLLGSASGAARGILLAASGLVISLAVEVGVLCLAAARPLARTTS